MSSPPSMTMNDGVGGQTTTGSSQSLKPSILIILLILAMTILVSISVCLLLRFLNRHCLRQLSPSSSTATTATIIASTSSSSSNRHSGYQHHHHRVAPETPQFSVLDSLPIFTFGSISRRSSAGMAMSTGDCPVCLSKFELQDELRLLPLCCHAFHAACIDTWLVSNQTCPLCRSPIQASESDILKALSVSNDGGGSADSFRLEIGSVSLRRPDSAAESRASYSLGSFDYIVEEDSEISMGNTHRRSVSDKEIGAPVAQPMQESSLAAEVGGGRSWLKEYVDRLSTSLSSRAHSFRSSGRIFTGSSGRTELGSAGDYDLEANHLGEEISELFRWVSGV